MKKIDIRKPLIVLLVVAIAACAVFIVNFWKSKEYVDLTEGRKYIKTQEKLAVEDVEESIKEKKSNEVSGAKEDGDVFSQFNDYVFYGDSRVLHFVSYGFLSPTYVFAENGYSFQDVQDWDYRLRSVNPSKIYISYGSNDINRNIYVGQGKPYKAIVVKSLKHIQEICPDAEIYVLGMIPPNALGQSQLNQFKLYKSLNLVYQEVCDEMDHVNYIDDEVLGDDGNASEIYTLDGFHFVKEFYPVWAQYIIDHTKQ